MQARVYSVGAIVAHAPLPPPLRGIATKKKRTFLRLPQRKVKIGKIIFLKNLGWGDLFASQSDLIPDS